MYGQFAIFIFAAWAGTSGGGVIAGLAVCGVVVAAVSQAAVLMQARKSVHCWCNHHFDDQNPYTP